MELALKQQQLQQQFLRGRPPFSQPQPRGVNPLAVQQQVKQMIQQRSAVR